MTRAHFDDGMHDSDALARGGYYFAPGAVKEYSPRTSMALYAAAVIVALCLVAAIAVAAGYLVRGPL